MKKFKFSLKRGQHSSCGRPDGRRMCKTIQVTGGETDENNQTNQKA